MAWCQELKHQALLFSSFRPGYLSNLNFFINYDGIKITLNVKCPCLSSSQYLYYWWGKVFNFYPHSIPPPRKYHYFIWLLDMLPNNTSYSVYNWNIFWCLNVVFKITFFKKSYLDSNTVHLISTPQHSRLITSVLSDKDNIRIRQGAR